MEVRGGALFTASMTLVDSIPGFPSPSGYWALVRFLLLDPTAWAWEKAVQPAWALQDELPRSGSS